jgi:hypothetical protein
VPDLLVSAPMEPYTTAPQDIIVRGSVFLFSGATRGLLWEYTGEHPGNFTGQQVQLIDDQNGDGLADWGIASRYFDADPSDQNSLDEGRVVIFAGAPGDATPVCTGGPNSAGTGAVLWNSGPISVRENGLELVVSEMPPATAVLLIHGRLGSPTPFGAGELCVAQPLGVLAFLTTDSGGPPGTTHFARAEVDLQSPPFTRGGNVVHPGDTWAFQALYRQQGQRNTSNALDVVFVP